MSKNQIIFFWVVVIFGAVQMSYYSVLWMIQNPSPWLITLAVVCVVALIAEIVCCILDTKSRKKKEEKADQV